MNIALLRVLLGELLVDEEQRREIVCHDYRVTILKVRSVVRPVRTVQVAPQVFLLILRSYFKRE